MEKLSVVIITYNEERNIGRALKSVQNIADEVIVVDSFSTDKTQDIVEAHGAKFIQRKWQGYADQKNFANQLANFAYIFSLDADEEVDAELEKEILKVKSNGFNGVYVVNRLVNYCGQWIKHSTWYPDKKIRIFPKTLTAWEGEFVHETLNIEEGGVQTELKGHLNHYTYYNYKEHRKRADMYSFLTAKKMHANGKKASVVKPYLSALARFVSMYIVHLGFLDGFKGFKIAQISAQSNIFKYKELRRLNHEN
ncbi:MAG: glycosyltransferase family 2 protein [Putridiphycobacter sp.]